MNRTMPPGREFTDALAALKRGGVVFDDFLQKPHWNRHKSSEKAHATNPTETTNMGDPNATTNSTSNSSNSTPRSNGISFDDDISPLRRLAAHFMNKDERKEPAFTVFTQRRLSERMIDGSITAGAVLLGGTAVVAMAKYAFGIGKAPKAPSSI